MNTASLTSTAAPVRGFTRTVTGRILIGLAATLLVAVAAHVSLPLWFTPVPLTMQPFAVLAIGLVLGPLDSACVMLAYLAEGIAGLPVFAPSPVAPGGIAQVVGFTGGFLMSYPLVAALAAAVARRASRLPRLAAGILGAAAGSVLLFACGAGWFAHLTRLPLPIVWAKTIAPFLIGGAIHILMAAVAFRLFARTTSHRTQQ